jgi:polyhydroxyalkanoate synthesis regulator phasin
MNANNKITEEKAKLIEQMVAEGKLTGEIAKEIGVSEETIRNFFKRTGITPNVYIKISEDKIEQFFDLANTGATLHKIREVTGLGNSTIKSLAIKYGFDNIIKTPKEAATSRCLTIEQAQERVKDGVVESFNIEERLYKIVCSDGFVYYKKTSKLGQGRPTRKVPEKRIGK